MRIDIGVVSAWRAGHDAVVKVPSGRPYYRGRRLRFAWLRREANRTAMAMMASAAAVALSGCGTLEGGRGWGQDAGYPVQWERVKSAALNAVTDPWTWAPAAGAAVFAVEDWDHRTSDWAVKHNPVFGSESFARDMSDHQRSAAMAGTFLTLALTPSGEEPLDWTLAKARGAAVEGAALLATGGVTSQLKEWMKRDRPDASNDNSMPSAHSSSAFSAARLSNRNLDAITMNAAARHSLKALNFGLATSVAWARVEGEKHYPSDVLVGAALGNLLSTFIHDAFMNLPAGEEEAIAIYVEPSPRGIWAAVGMRF